ncbi:MAG: hypothetical protein HY543_11790 [Deltaproteobacteria bacterium]|nr:hypothetical protein [Deltaproteobacteria bacterium]
MPSRGWIVRLQSGAREAATWCADRMQRFAVRHSFVVHALSTTDPALLSACTMANLAGLAGSAMAFPPGGRRLQLVETGWLVPPEFVGRAAEGDVAAARALHAAAFTLGGAKELAAWKTLPVDGLIGQACTGDPAALDLLALGLRHPMPHAVNALARVADTVPTAVRILDAVSEERPMVRAVLRHLDVSRFATLAREADNSSPIVVEALAALVTCAQHRNLAALMVVAELARADPDGAAAHVLRRLPQDVLLAAAHAADLTTEMGNAIRAGLDAVRHSQAAAFRRHTTPPLDLPSMDDICGCLATYVKALRDIATDAQGASLSRPQSSQVTSLLEQLKAANHWLEKTKADLRWRRILLWSFPTLQAATDALELFLRRIQRPPSELRQLVGLLDAAVAIFAAATQSRPDDAPKGTVILVRNFATSREINNALRDDLGWTIAMEEEMQRDAVRHFQAVRLPNETMAMAVRSVGVVELDAPVPRTVWIARPGNVPQDATEPVLSLGHLPLGMFAEGVVDPVFAMAPDTPLAT